jgi:hypothetical protein
MFMVQAMGFEHGPYGTGEVQLIACGGWALVDFIVIATGSLGDADGMPLKRS